MKIKRVDCSNIAKLGYETGILHVLCLLAYFSRQSPYKSPATIFLNPKLFFPSSRIIEYSGCYTEDFTRIGSGNGTIELLENLVNGIRGREDSIYGYFQNRGILLYYLFNRHPQDALPIFNKDLRHLMDYVFNQREVLKKFGGEDAVSFFDTGMFLKISEVFYDREEYTPIRKAFADIMDPLLKNDRYPVEFIIPAGTNIKDIIFKNAASEKLWMLPGQESFFLNLNKFKLGQMELPEIAREAMKIYISTKDIGKTFSCLDRIARSKTLVDMSGGCLRFFVENAYRGGEFLPRRSWQLTIKKRSKIYKTSGEQVGAFLHALILEHRRKDCAMLYTSNGVELIERIVKLILDDERFEGKTDSAASNQRKNLLMGLCDCFQLQVPLKGKQHQYLKTFKEWFNKKGHESIFLSIAES